MQQRYTPTQILILLGILALLLWQMQGFANPGSFFTPGRGLLWWLIGLVIGITVHEASHALAADRLGDPTPRAMGRVSLNPIRHMDPMGTFMLLVAHFGWGKPVVFDPSRLKVDPALGSALVSLAGPAANVLTAFFAAQLVRSGVAVDPWSVSVLLGIIQVNVLLAAFNLIPIPPLDGFGFVTGLLPKPLSYQLQPLRQYGPMLLLLLIFLPQLGGPNILARIYSPIAGSIAQLIGLGGFA